MRTDQDHCRRFGWLQTPLGLISQVTQVTCVLRMGLPELDKLVLQENTAPVLGSQASRQEGGGILQAQHTLAPRPLPAFRSRGGWFLSM